MRSWDFLSLYWSGSSTLEASWEARHTFWICVAPLRLGGLRGKQSTPSDWLGGTGEVSTIGERERHGEWEAALRAGRGTSAGRHARQAKGHRYVFHILGDINLYGRFCLATGIYKL